MPHCYTNQAVNFDLIHPFTIRIIRNALNQEAASQTRNKRQLDGINQVNNKNRYTWREKKRYRIKQQRTYQLEWLPQLNEHDNKPECPHEQLIVHSKLTDLCQPIRWIDLREQIRSRKIMTTRDLSEPFEIAQCRRKQSKECYSPKGATNILTVI